MYHDFSRLSIVENDLCNCENLFMTKDLKKILAKNVKRLWKSSGLSQEELSLELDFDGSYIGKVENAKLNITIDKIAKIADYFGVEPMLLFKNKK